jgi:hypothetical protein
MNERKRAITIPPIVIPPVERPSAAEIERRRKIVDEILKLRAAMEPISTEELIRELREEEEIGA